jgi:hypothetical protein
MAVNPGRSYVFTNARIGLETTAGTAVAATKRLLSTVRLRPQKPTEAYRSAGSQFPLDATSQKEQMVGTIEGGRINMGGDIIYWLGSLLEASEVASGLWLFKPATFGPDPRNSYTLQRGPEGGNGEKVPFVMCDSLEFTWNRTQADVQGTVYGAELLKNQALTTGLPIMTKALAIPGKVKIEVGDAPDNLTKLTGCLQAGFGIRGTTAPKYTLDDALDSFGTIKAMAPALSSRLVVENDSVAAGMLADLRTSALRFLQITSYGPLGLGVGGAERYYTRILTGYKYSDEDIGETEDLDTGMFDMIPVYDEEFAGCFEIEVKSGMSAY